MDDSIEDYRVEQIFEDYLSMEVSSTEQYYKGRKYNFTELVFTNGLKLYYDEAYLIGDYEYGILKLYRNNEAVIEFRFKYE